MKMFESKTGAALATTACAVLAMSALPASASIVAWYTSIDEVQAGQLAAGTSNPNNDPTLPASSGTGGGSGTYDTDTHIFTWNFSIAGLGSPATVAHIHFGAPGVFRGPIRIETPSLDIGALVGNTSGSFSGFQDLDDAFTPGLPAGGIRQLETEFMAGNWYFNLHTRNFGAGEIRGQLNIPEPASLALVALGLAAIPALRRRKPK